MFCREQVARLAEQASAFAAIPAEVVVIGSGSPFQARRFAEERALPLRLWTDPSRRSFEAVGFARSWRSTLGAASTYSNALRALGAGHFQGTTQGDPWQLGGALVISAADRGAVVTYAFQGEVAGEHPDPLRLLQAAREAAALPPRG